MQRQEEVTRSPETGVKMVFNDHVGAGNRTHVLWKESQCFQPLDHLQALIFDVLIFVIPDKIFLAQQIVFLPLQL